MYGYGGSAGAVPTAGYAAPPPPPPIYLAGVSQPTWPPLEQSEHPQEQIPAPAHLQEDLTKRRRLVALFIYLKWKCPGNSRIRP